MVIVHSYVNITRGYNLTQSLGKTNRTINNIHSNIWLVVFRLPLWKIWKSSGMMRFPTEWENKIHVPNLPIRIYHYIHIHRYIICVSNSSEVTSTIHNFSTFVSCFKMCQVDLTNTHQIINNIHSNIHSMDDPFISHRYLWIFSY